MDKFCALITLCVLITSYFSNVIGTSDTPRCGKDAEGFKQCLIDEHDKNIQEDKKKLHKINTRVAQCFTDNGCPSPANVTGLQEIEGAWQNMPQGARKCFADMYRSLALDVINECLAQQKVDQIKELNDEDSDLDEFTNSTLPHVWFAKGLLRVAIALKDCRAEVDAKNANATVSCLVTVKKDILDAVCKRADKCRKDKVSDTCYKQNQKIHQALCACGQSTLKSIIKSIEDFEKQSEDVFVQHIVGTFYKSWHADQIVNGIIVTKCLKDNKVNLTEVFDVDEVVEGLTTYLTIAVRDPTGPAHAVLGLLLSIQGIDIGKSELSEIRAVLKDILQNIDCGCTKSSSRLFY